MFPGRTAGRDFQLWHCSIDSQLATRWKHKIYHPTALVVYNCPAGFCVCLCVCVCGWRLRHDDVVSCFGSYSLLCFVWEMELSYWFHFPVISRWCSWWRWRWWANERWINNWLEENRWTSINRFSMNDDGTQKYMKYFHIKLSFNADGEVKYRRGWR